MKTIAPGPLLALLLVAACVNAAAAVPLTFTRQDGAGVPALAYPPAGRCHGVVIISPGAGGTEKGLDYLGDALGAAGWLAVVVGHRESGPATLKSDLRRHGVKGGLQEMVTDPKAYAARFADIDAALAWVDAHRQENTAHDDAPRCDARFTALLGHSMGAATVMMEAGARNEMGISGRNRFDAYVALSPQGPGSVFPAGAWQDIAAPVLMLTGTRDKALEGDWTSRTVPYDNLRGHCQWLGIIDGATHMNFAGHGYARKTRALTVGTTLEFLGALAAGHCGTPPALDGITFRRK